MKYLKLFENTFEEDWEEKEYSKQYYIGTIIYDNIEIYPCNIGYNTIFRIPDNYEILKYNPGIIPIRSVVSTEGVFIHTPQLLRYGKLVYIYSNETKKDVIKDALIKAINETTGGDLKEALTRIINTHDVVYYGEDGININLI